MSSSLADFMKLHPLPLDPKQEKHIDKCLHDGHEVASLVGWTGPIISGASHALYCMTCKERLFGWVDEPWGVNPINLLNTIDRYERRIFFSKKVEGK